MTKMLWGFTYVIALVCFVSFLLWIFTDETKFKVIWIITFAFQIYGILTKEGVKNS